MASVVKNVKNRIPAIPGTKPSIKNSQLLISTGIPSLDHMIGGGLPIGSIFVIEEDKYGLYAKVMLKYFMAEGVVTSQPILIASQDVQPSKLVSELPAVINDSNLQTEVTSAEHMKIAWRYQNMKAVDSSPTGSQVFGHFYDLTKSMQQELLEQAYIQEWHQDNLQGQNNMFENIAYADLLHTIQETLHNGKYSVDATPEKRNILRIAIHSLGSRLWLCDTTDSSNRDLLKFLYCLRSLLRNSYAVGLITIPVNNFDTILHLPPEFVDTAQREQDDVITSSTGCGSGKIKFDLF
ncbi:elongator complex protein 4 isoform X2 [Odontomachus brunneus]|uniref:elongator complex protein 4 isoform X2 n=1 Tax=Odontomachus brunneus TaxID=486640 RepID=UPI0013F1CB64|nr:elongator complex protein 4 isoform X2 [Odontomachus brunneus]